MDPNQNQSNPTPTEASKQAELVVAWYQQKLAEAQQENANLWATNHLLGESLKAATSQNDPNAPAG